MRLGLWPVHLKALQSPAHRNREGYVYVCHRFLYFFSIEFYKCNLFEWKPPIKNAGAS